MKPATALKPLQQISRRGVVKGLGAAAGALLLSNWGCSRRRLQSSSCFQAAGAKVRYIVPFPPGGGYDFYSRLLEPYFEKTLGAEIALENMPGAAGVIAANTLKASNPDGLTLGMLNAPGLLVSAMTGESSAPDPVKDFTILGRIFRNQTVWFTGAGSPLRTIDDVIAESKKRPILFGASETGSTNFVNMSVAASLLGIEAEFITGFAGSRETSMAVVRGEVDISSFTFESMLDRIEAQDLRPILQCSTERISPHPSLEGVALLCGEQGIATRRAIELARDSAQVEANARALNQLIGAGIIVAAPPRLSDTLALCLEQKLYEALTGDEFQAAAARANRPLYIGRGAETVDELQVAAGQAAKFLPIVREAIKRIRG